MSGMRWFVVLALAVMTGAMVRAGSSALAETRTILDQWVQTRHLISKSRLDWQAEQETLKASAAMFEKELDVLAGRLAELGKGSAEVERERATLEAEKASLEGVLEGARLKVTELEGRLPLLVRRLPEVLVNRLKPLMERLPGDPGGTRMRVTERFQTVVGILNEIDKFASSISVESEIRQAPEGQQVEVQTLYVGLAQAYFVGEAGRFAGVGVPTETGWKWTQRDGVAEAVQKAIAVYRNQQPAVFVQLPVSVN